MVRIRLHHLKSILIDLHKSFHRNLSAQTLRSLCNFHLNLTKILKQKKSTSEWMWQETRNFALTGSFCSLKNITKDSLLSIFESTTRLYRVLRNVCFLQSAAKIKLQIHCTSLFQQHCKVIHYFYSYQCWWMLWNLLQQYEQDHLSELCHELVFIQSSQRDYSNFTLHKNLWFS